MNRHGVRLAAILLLANGALLHGQSISATRPGEQTDGANGIEIAGDLSNFISPEQAETSTRPSDPTRIIRIGSWRFVGFNLSAPAFSPDGSQVVVTSANNPTQIFDVKTGQSLASLAPAQQTMFATNEVLVQRTNRDMKIVRHDGTVLYTLQVPMPQRMAISHDGKRLVVASGAPLIPPGVKLREQPPEPTITLWNIETGERISDLGPVAHLMEAVPQLARSYRAFPCMTNVAFDSGQTLLTIAADGHVRRWDAQSGNPLPTADIVIDPALSMSFAPNGKSIVLSDVVPRQIDLDTGVCSPLPHIFPIITGSSRIPQPANAPQVPLKPMMTTQPITPLNIPTQIVKSIEFSPDGSSLVFCSTGRIDRWALVKGQELRPVEFDGYLSGYAISPDNRRLAVTERGQLFLYDCETGELSPKPSAPLSTIESVSIAPDASAAIVSDANGSLYRFDLATGRVTEWRKVRISHNESFSSPPHASAYTADGTAVLTIDLGTQVMRRDPITLAPLDPPQLLAHHLYQPFFSPNATDAIGFAENDAWIQPLDGPADRANQGVRRCVGFPQRTPAALSADRQHFAAALNGKLALISLDKEGIQKPHDLLLPSNPNDDSSGLPVGFTFQALDFTPDAQTLVGVSVDGPVAIDVSTATINWFKPLKRSFRLRALALSDDGRLMAYTDNDSSIDIANTENGRLIATLKSSLQSVHLIQFLPGTTRLIASDFGRSMEVLDWQPAVLSQQAETFGNQSNADRWAALSSDAPSEAYAALFALMQNPGDLLQQAATVRHTSNVPTQIKRWIAGLSSPELKERERCHLLLERAGPAAGEEIRYALYNTPAGEAHDRLKALSDLLAMAAGETLPDPTAPEQRKIAFAVTPAARRAARIIEALDWLHTPEAAAVLKSYATSDDPGLASLSRIALAHRRSARP